MRRYSVSYAKNNLSALLALVRGGKRLLIADRGVPIAVLGPVTGETGRGDERLEELVRSGLVTCGTEDPPEGMLASPPPRVRRGAGAVAALIAERRSGW